MRMWDLIPGGYPELPGGAAGGGRAVGFGRPGPDAPEVDALVDGAAVETQVQVLVVVLLHRVHHLLGHPHGEGQVAAHLPHHDGGADVLGLDLHVLPGNLLHHAQGVGAVPVPSVLGAVGERGRQLVRLGVVRLLVHALLEVLEDDCKRPQKTRVPPFIAVKNLPVNPQNYAPGSGAGPGRSDILCG
uniref:Uncharacterized protein n=1 Tax=Salarias fasciatus TaxID=181472 RepID=A0A672FZ07_SALFA